MKNEYFWPPEARTKHLYIAGRSGYGKSTLMASLIMGDVETESRRAIAVIDPKGDLVNQLIHHIPEERVDDTIYLSPKSPIPIDFMSWTDKYDREMAVNDIVALFHRLDPGWGARMGALLKYAVLTLLHARRTSFLEIQRILVDEQWREEILKPITDPAIRQFWDVEYGNLPKDAKSPITVSRMADFILSESLRHILGAGTQLNIQEAIESNKILLVGLGGVGSITDSGMILGSLIVSKIQQAIFRREPIPIGERKPFCLYVDEFQNFRTTAFSTMLTQARGFNLSACLANQHPKQLLEAGILDDMKGCVSSYVFFQMDSDHARLMRSQIAPHEPESLEKLPVGHALYSMADGERAFVHTPGPLGHSDASYAETIRKRTMERYPCESPSEMGIIGKRSDDEPKPTGRPKKLSAHKSKTGSP